jgi:DNA-binding CsgD family transcriptional regulator
MDRAQHSVELTDRQREVLRLVVRGHTNGEIADKLGISLQGAKWHVRELLTKFGVESREELIEARAAERTLATKFRALAGLVTGFSLPKASVAAAVGGVALTTAGFVMVLEGPGTLAGVSVATPTPTRTAPEKRATVEALNAALGGFDPSASAEENGALFLDRTEPAGPEIVVAWLNSVPGADEYTAVYPTKSGLWCQTDQRGMRLCWFDPANPDGPIKYGRDERYDTNTKIRESRLHVQSSEEVVRAEIHLYDGRVAQVLMEDPPPGVPRGTKWALADVGLLDGDPPLIIGYDVHGREVGRRTGQGWEPPPGAGAPPPPPPATP